MFKKEVEKYELKAFAKSFVMRRLLVIKKRAEEGFLKGFRRGRLLEVFSNENDEV